MPHADRPISPRPSAVPPRPTNRKLFVAALGAVLLALTVGAAYHLVEARTATGRTAVGLRMGLANPARDLGLIEPARGRDYAAYGFTDETGKALGFGAFAGKVLLVNFWATWCGPCRSEMPALDRLAAQLESDDFAVLAVAVDRGGAAAVRAFYEELSISHLAVYLDPGAEALGAIGITGIPTTLVLGRDGRELGRFLGTRAWDARPMIAFLARYRIAGQGAGKGAGA